MNRSLRLLAPLGLLLAGLLASLPAKADYPERTVRLVVPYPAGGATDAAARILAERLGAAWKQPVIVENKPGAGGSLGMQAVARSPADGYTFVAATSSTAINDELLRPGLAPVQVPRDLVPAASFFTTPAVFVVAGGLGAETLAQFVAVGKSKGATLSYGSIGDGTNAHLYGELLNKAAGLSMTHVPYAGEGPVLVNVMGGHVSSGFLSAGNARKALQSGTARLLAVAGVERSPLLPEVPTFKEQGVPGIERGAWVGFFAPAATPAAVLEKFSAEVQRILSAPDVRERFAGMGVAADPGTLRELEQRVQADKIYWAKAIQDSGVKLK